jgi:hypothetical protein
MVFVGRCLMLTRTANRVKTVEMDLMRRESLPGGKPHSCRMAASGSILDARRAGT